MAATVVAAAGTIGGARVYNGNYFFWTVSSFLLVVFRTHWASVRRRATSRGRCAAMMRAEGGQVLA